MLSQYFRGLMLQIEDVIKDIPVAHRYGYLELYRLIDRFGKPGITLEEQKTIVKLVLEKLTKKISSDLGPFVVLESLIKSPLVRMCAHLNDLSLYDDASFNVLAVLEDANLSSVCYAVNLLCHGQSQVDPGPLRKIWTFDMGATAHQILLQLFTTDNPVVYAEKLRLLYDSMVLNPVTLGYFVTYPSAVVVNTIIDNAPRGHTALPYFAECLHFIHSHRPHSERLASLIGIALEFKVLMCDATRQDNLNHILHHPAPKLLLKLVNILCPTHAATPLLGLGLFASIADSTPEQVQVVLDILIARTPVLFANQETIELWESIPEHRFNAEIIREMMALSETIINQEDFVAALREKAAFAEIPGL